MPSLALIAHPGRPGRVLDAAHFASLFAEEATPPERNMSRLARMRHALTRFPKRWAPQGA